MQKVLIEEQMAVASAQLIALLGRMVSMPNDTRDLLSNCARLLGDGHGQIVVARQQVREQGEQILTCKAECDQTIADLRELLEFKRKELATLSREVQRLRAVDGPAKYVDGPAK